MQVCRMLRSSLRTQLTLGTYLLEYTDSSTSCSRVVEVPKGNASRRAVAPVPRATVRMCRTRMLSAALWSAGMHKSQRWQAWLVCRGSTVTNCPHLYCRRWASWPQLLANMLRFRPDLALTCVPGLFWVPLADWVMRRVCRSSATRAWALLHLKPPACVRIIGGSDRRYDLPTAPSQTGNFAFHACCVQCSTSRDRPPQCAVAAVSGEPSGGP